MEADLLSVSVLLLHADGDETEQVSSLLTSLES